MTSHEKYTVDGIRQEDAPVPAWWRIGFLTLMCLSPIYFLYFHSGAEGRSAVELYESKMEVMARKKYAEIGELQPTAATILEYMEKDNWLKVGKVVFKSQCANCHGRDGEGKIGPNLTDNYYKNVRAIEDIARVIAKGANNNAMPAWEDKLLTNDIVLVSAYVASLRDTNAEGGKGQEGSDIPPWTSESEESE